MKHAAALVRSFLASSLRSRAWRASGVFALCALAAPALAAPPANDECAGATPLVLGLNAYTNVEATTTASPAVCSSITKDVWYSYVPATSGILTVTNCGQAPSGYDTVIAIYSATGPCTGLVSLVCNDGGGACSVNEASASAAVTAGTQYYVRFGTFGTTTGQAGSFQATLVLPPANDTCAGAPALTLDTPVTGTTVNASNDYQTTGTFAGIGQSATTSPGRDVVYTFTAPVAGQYSFRITNYASGNASLYVANACPVGAPPQNVTVLAGANRTTTGSFAAEEVYCVSMSLGQLVYVYVDETAAAGSTFTLEVNNCTQEVEPNGTPAAANTFVFGMEGSITPAADADFLALGSPASGSRVFAMVDGIAASSADFDLRVTTSTDTLEYDDAGNDTAFGGLAPNTAGTPLTGAASFLRVSHFGVSAQSEPYRVYGVVRPSIGAAELETEPNDLVASANFRPTGYVSGATSGGSDIDLYQFTLNQGELLFASLDGDPLRNNTPINATLALLNASGSVLVSVNDTGSTSSTTSGTGSLTATTPNSPGEALTYRVPTTGTYFVRVTAATAGDYLLSASVHPQLPLHCAASAAACGTGNEWISNVTIGSINNTTGEPSVCYEDFTSLSTSVTLGSSLALSVTGGAPFLNDVASAWVDWNQDGDFDDLSEAFPLDDSANPATVFLGTIGPPPSALLGTTRLRIRLSWGDSNDNFPCGVSGYGQVEDYTLIVLPAPPTPPNDLCSNAQVIGNGVFAGTTVNGTNDGSASCDSGGGSSRDVWYAYTASGAGDLSISTCGSATDTVVSVYSACGGSEIACNDNCGGSPCGGTASCLTVALTNGQSVRIRVSDKGGTAGTFSLTTSFALAGDLCANAFVVAVPSSTNGTTVGATLDAGLTDCTNFAPSITNNGGNAGYSAPGVWYRVVGTGGTVTADTLVSSYDTRLHVFTGTCGLLTCVTANDDISGGFKSKVAFATVLNQDYYILVSGFSTLTGTFTLNVTGDTTPSNDECSLATTVNPLGDSVLGTTVGSTGAGFTPTSTSLASCATNANNPLFDVWYTFVAPCSTNVTIGTCGAYDTLLSVHSACPTLSVGNQVAGACNDNGTVACPPGSQLTIAVTNGTQYWIRVAGALGINAGGAFTLTLSATDGDGDGTPDCNDGCPADPLKIAPGVCGCGVADTDSDGDGTPNCNDGCPLDPAKIAPGVCGCGVPDIDSDGDGTLDCNDGCPADPAKITPGTCGCGVADTDTDADGTPDCNDGCPADPLKIAPGTCGCGVPDTLVNYYPDLDGDSFGLSGSTPVSQCANLPAPPNTATNDDDCDDGDAAVNPLATEICGDLVDNDCDGFIDEGFATPTDVYVDDDFALLPGGTDPPGPGTAIGCDSFATIQDGVDAVAIGGTVHVAAGSYGENVAVTKAVAIIGEGSGTNPSTDTIVTAADANVSVFAISASNVSISALRTTGATNADGIRIDSSGSTFAFTDIHAAGNTNGVHLAASGGVVSDVDLTDCVLSNNLNAGLRVASAMSSTTALHVVGGAMENNTFFGFSFNPSGVATCLGDDIDFDGVTFTNNGGVFGTGHLSYFGYNGSADLKDLTLSGPTFVPIQFRGAGDPNTPGTWSPLGALTIDNVSVAGNAARAGLYIHIYSTLPSVDLSGLDLSGMVNTNGPFTGFSVGGMVLAYLAGNVDLNDTVFPCQGTGYVGLALFGTGNATATCDTVFVGATTDAEKETCTFDVDDLAGVGNMTITGSTLWYLDQDGDGAGDPGSSTLSCDQPLGYVGNDDDDCPTDPLKTAPGQCGCGNADTDTDGDGTADCNDGCPSDPLKIAPGTCGCGVSDADTDGDGTADCNDLCPSDPLKTAPGQCGCGNADTDTDGDGTADCNDGCPSDPLKIAPGICGCGIADTDTDGDLTPDCNDGCPSDPLKIAPGTCGCGVSDADTDGDGTADCNDLCPSDPFKTAPGQCGCGNADTDSDGDGTADCNDGCPSDPLKIAPGTCGCGVSDADTDGDGTADCNDLCPSDPLKTAPGQCGCGVSDADTDGDGTADCNDGCPTDPLKTAPGACGCGVADTDTDGDGVADCVDGCPTDPLKIAPGDCGCGTPDVDTDGDGTADCNDGCPSDPLKIAPGICGCGIADTDTDGDGAADCNDGCPSDPLKIAPGICGCGISDADTDGDGTADCNDGCPSDPLKIAPGICGCGISDADSDGDGAADCNDGCPSDPLKTAPGQCGCGNADTDSDGDGTADCNDGCPSDPLKTAPGTCGCGNADTFTTYYPDADGDTFGQNGGAPIVQCANLPAPANTATNDDDCDDSNAAINPNGTEICGNGIDEDCSGIPDDGFGAVSDVYVDDDFASLNPGDDPVGPGTAFGCDSFATIQEGINAVAPGGTVHVAAGTYVENVTVPVSCTIEGPHAGVCAGASLDRGSEATVFPAANAPIGGIVFYVTADDVVIDGMRIDGDNLSISGGEAVGPADSNAAHAIGNGTFDDGAKPPVDIDGLIVRNTIIANFNDIAVLLYNSGAFGSVSSFNEITCNRIDNVRGDNSLGFERIAVLLYNDTYARVDDNTLTRVSIGVQTGNNWQTMEVGGVASISGNEVTFDSVGIWHNLHYANASSWTIHNNDLDSIGVKLTDEPWGLYVTSLQGSVAVDIAGNDVSNAWAGVRLWNLPTTSTVTINGGTLIGNFYSVVVTNFDPTYADGDPTSVIIDGTTMSTLQPDLYGVYIDGATGANDVHAEVRNISATGFVAGVQVFGSLASAYVHDCPQLALNFVGVGVDAGRARVETSNLVGNELAGGYVASDAIADFGDCGDNDVTGLGSSVGGNTLTGYSGVTEYAIFNQNPSTGPVVLAENNDFGFPVPVSDVEDVIYDNADDAFVSDVLASQSGDTDGDGTPNCNDECPLDPAKTAPGTCGCGVADTDTDGDGTADCNDGCPNDPAKVTPGLCGCGISDDDTDGDGTADCSDGCPTDPFKTSPGACGCGSVDTDTDGDGTADCVDGCPTDPAKVTPGICGCGTHDSDSDGDGTPNCIDGCPTDPGKVAPGICGCGVADTDTDGDGAVDCIDDCPTDPAKTSPGVCGCGIADTDTDGDGTADCLDGCPTDPAKIAPGVCGCGTHDTDTDGDGTPNCIDGCPTDPGKIAPGICGCGTPDADSDNDGTVDCIDACPSDPNKSAPGVCGCGTPDVDSDLDTVPDCIDQCDGFPDQDDCNNNGVPDGCDIFIFATSVDINGDLIPDECQCLADLDDDGDVDGADLALLLGSWDNPGIGDVNWDNTTDGADLALLLGAWGPCPVF